MTLSDRVSALSALDVMARRKVITPRQLAAGRRLFVNYALAVVGTHHRGSAGAQIPPVYMDARIAAKRDYEGARDAVGARIWPVLWAVVCGDQSVQEIATERGLNPTATMTTLKLGLDILGDHYRLDEGT